jgi:hypothetical protein
MNRISAAYAIPDVKVARFRRAVSCHLLLLLVSWNATSRWHLVAV